MSVSLFCTLIYEQTIFINTNFLCIYYQALVSSMSDTAAQSDSAVNSEQSALLEKAVKVFTQQFSSPTHAACAPGRVNLIGEHTDYNDGFVFPIVSYLVLESKDLS